MINYFHVWITNLQDTTLDLDFRVTVIEDNGNQTISELEVRVETLEGIAADHETRLTSAEADIEGLTTYEVMGFIPSRMSIQDLK